MAITTKKTTTVKKAVVSKTTAPKIVEAIPTPVKTGLAKYINKNLKVSPRKLRLVVTAIKNLDPATAYTRLKFTNSNAAQLLARAVQDVIASAKNNHHLDPATLKFSEMRVDEGMKIKRMDKSHGSRFARGIIQKRHSRLVIVLSGTIQS
ncbi:MAG: uL22 family ribosomal protein [Microgenomates group bacterium]